MARGQQGKRGTYGGFGRYDCEVLVIGGGIVGLSTAYALSRAAPGARVMVLEKEHGPARHQSGHNSGVVHSGVYYRPGSLKARFATAGVAETAAFCAGHGVPHETTGKLIVATERAELPRLHALAQRGRENGIAVSELGPAQIIEREPEVRGLAALHVPSTGVCDYPALARALAHASGAELRYGAEVTRIARRPGDGVAVRVTPAAPEGGARFGTGSGSGSGTGSGSRPAPAAPATSAPSAASVSASASVSRPGEYVVRARVLVNCAGLQSDRIALLAGDEPGMRIVPFRGEYYELTRPELVRGLVYPVPDPAFPFLGTHLTRGIDGSVHVGPNAVPALAREGYTRGRVSARELSWTLTWPGSLRLAREHWRYGAGEIHRSLSKHAFTQAVRRLLPEVGETDLRPAPAGVRAQAVLRDGSLVDDFLIREAPRTVHVLNAPSPAATAALPIGREIARRALARLGTERPLPEPIPA